MNKIDAALDAERLVREAPIQASGSPFLIGVKRATASTNDDVRALAAVGAPEGTVICAEEQAAGRGRRGNVWIAPARRCLLLSILLRPADDPPLWPRVTHLAALAVCRAIAPFLVPDCPQVKWPNDVMVGDRKIAGILLESSASSSGGFLVLGIGINVNIKAHDFPAELQSAATSLLIESGATIDRTGLLLNLLREFSTLYPLGVSAFDQPLSEVHQRSNLLGREVTLTVSGNLVSGRVVGFGESGELQLKPDDGPICLVSSGELVRVKQS
ncbi:MAG: biotin--[acetyl-CoA-carboxylase] ligase [Verrucomicrobiales bacterium]